MTEKVEAGNEITPLNELSKRTAVVSIFSKLKSCLVGERSNVNQDLQNIKIRNL